MTNKITISRDDLPKKVEVTAIPNNITVTDSSAKTNIVEVAQGIVAGGGEGPAGPQGDPGTDGTDGTTGTTGNTGATGATGATGKTGADGTTGTTGNTGNTGTSITSATLSPAVNGGQTLAFILETVNGVTTGITAGFILSGGGTGATGATGLPVGVRYQVTTTTGEVSTSGDPGKVFFKDDLSLVKITSRDIDNSDTSIITNLNQNSFFIFTNDDYSKERIFRTNINAFQSPGGSQSVFSYTNITYVKQAGGVFADDEFVTVMRFTAGGTGGDGDGITNPRLIGDNLVIDQFITQSGVTGASYDLGSVVGSAGSTGKTGAGVTGASLTSVVNGGQTLTFVVETMDGFTIGLTVGTIPQGGGTGATGATGATGIAGVTAGLKFYPNAGGSTVGIDPTAVIHIAGISSDGGATFGGNVRILSDKNIILNSTASIRNPDSVPMIVDLKPGGETGQVAIGDVNDAGNGVQIVLNDGENNIQLISDDIQILKQLSHNTDPDTKITFQTNEVGMSAGGANNIRLSSTVTQIGTPLHAVEGVSADKGITFPDYTHQTTAFTGATAYKAGDGITLDVAGGTFSIDPTGIFVEKVFDFDGNNDTGMDISVDNTISFLAGGSNRLDITNLDTVFNSGITISGGVGIDGDILFAGADSNRIKVNDTTALLLDPENGLVRVLTFGLQIPDRLQHTDDTDTFLGFKTNAINLSAGGVVGVTLDASSMSIGVGTSITGGMTLDGVLNLPTGDSDNPATSIKIPTGGKIVNHQTDPASVSLATNTVTLQSKGTGSPGRVTVDNNKVFIDNVVLKTEEGISMDDAGLTFPLGTHQIAAAYGVGGGGIGFHSYFDGGTGTTQVVQGSNTKPGRFKFSFGGNGNDNGRGQTAATGDAPGWVNASAEPSTYPYYFHVNEFAASPVVGEEGIGNHIPKLMNLLYGASGATVQIGAGQGGTHLVSIVKITQQQPAHVHTGFANSDKPLPHEAWFGVKSGAGDFSGDLGQGPNHTVPIVRIDESGPGVRSNFDGRSGGTGGIQDGDLFYIDIFPIFGGGDGGGGGLSEVVGSYDGHIEFPNNDTYHLDSRLIRTRTISEFFAKVEQGVTGATAELHGGGTLIAGISLGVTGHIADSLNEPEINQGGTLEIRVSGVTTGYLHKDFTFSVGYVQGE